MSALAAWASLAWACAVAAVSAWAVVVLAWRTRARPPAAAPALRVLVLRPCAGAEPWLERALGSLADARGGLDLALRVAVADATDGARPAAERACAALRAGGRDATVVVTGAAAPNRKADQLARALAREPVAPDVVLVVDGDVDLAGADLAALVAPLADARAGAAWAPVVERGRATLGDRASAAVLGGSLHAFPVLAGLDPGGMVGKAMAVRHDALASAGGFAALVRYLGEDLELARRLRARGRAVVAAPFALPSLASGRSVGAVVARYARWLAVVRAQRAPLLAAYPALFFATPLVALLALAGFVGAPTISLAALGVALGARLGLALAARRAAGRPRSLAGAAVDGVLADALLAAALARALASRAVRWRGAARAVDATGALREDPTAR